MMDIQVDTLDGIDTKAARLIGFVGVFLGVTATVSRIFPSTDFHLVDSSSVAGGVALSIGVIGLLLTLTYGTVTYLSSEFEYGLDPGVADAFASVNELPADKYRGIVLRGYADTIRANEPVVKANARRFRYALAALVGSIFSLVFSAFYYLVEMPDAIEWVIFLFGTMVIGSLCIYIRDEGYLTTED